jgi:hypothetical protein
MRDERAVEDDAGGGIALCATGADEDEVLMAETDQQPNPSTVIDFVSLVYYIILEYTIYIVDKPDSDYDLKFCSILYLFIFTSSGLYLEC